MDFEYDALKAAHRTASLVRNAKGKPMNIQLDTLVVSRGTANHFRAVEMLGAMKKGWQPADLARESSGVPDYKIIPTSWILTNTAYWFMFDSRMKNLMYGLQYKESQPISLEGPHIVFRTGEQIKKLAHYWRKLIDIFSQIRLNSLIIETRPSQVLC
mgnify:CR=1 FL=1